MVIEGYIVTYRQIVQAIMILYIWCTYESCTNQYFLLPMNQ